MRPAAGGAERAEWDRLMDEHHYLGFRRLFGGGVRHVAETADGRWLALLGWQCGAFKAKARDAWIGWTPEQQFRRLRLVANNTRFLILPDARAPNLASRALSLSLRRLSSDMEAALGHPALLAETFVDPSRFEGTCCRASNWTELGETRGCAKSHGGWVAHGRPKRVFVRPLARTTAPTAPRNTFSADSARGQSPPPSTLPTTPDSPFAPTPTTGWPCRGPVQAVDRTPPASLRWLRLVQYGADMTHMRSAALGLLVCAGALGAGAADYGDAWGPAVGTPMPEVAALDQHGAERDLANLRGERGLLLFAVRSADW